MDGSRKPREKIRAGGCSWLEFWEEGRGVNAASPQKPKVWVGRMSKTPSSLRERGSHHSTKQAKPCLVGFRPICTDWWHTVIWVWLNKKTSPWLPHRVKLEQFVWCRRDPTSIRPNYQVYTEFEMNGSCSQVCFLGFRALELQQPAWK